MLEIDKIKHRRPVNIRHYTQTIRHIEQMSGRKPVILNEYLNERGKMAKCMKKRKKK